MPGGLYLLGIFKNVWKCWISDSLAVGGTANGGLTPSSEIYGDHSISNPRSGSRDFRIGGYDTGPIPISSTGIIPDRPQSHAIAITRYNDTRGHIPLVNWETISDSAESCYESYVAGNSSIRSPLCFCPNSKLPRGFRSYGNPNDTHEFRMCGKRAQGPTPSITHHQREATDKVLEIARVSMRVLFYLITPQ